MDEIFWNKGRELPLVKAIKDVEEFFFHEKEGELYKFLLTAIEKPMIENVLCKTEGNQLKTAKILGINRNTLRTKIRKLHINVEKFKYKRA
jgi:DNA-binding protein Fis